MVLHCVVLCIIILSYVNSVVYIITYRIVSSRVHKYYMWKKNKRRSWDSAVVIVSRNHEECFEQSEIGNGDKFSPVISACHLHTHCKRLGGLNRREDRLPRICIVCKDLQI